MGTSGILSILRAGRAEMKAESGFLSLKPSSRLQMLTKYSILHPALLNSGDPLDFYRWLLSAYNDQYLYNISCVTLFVFEYIANLVMLGANTKHVLSHCCLPEVSCCSRGLIICKTADL